MEVIGASAQDGKSGVLLTTCHLERDGVSDLLRLVASAEAALRGGEIDSLRHLILLQGCGPSQRGELGARLPDWIELLSTPQSLSSSDARNLLIQHLLKSDAFNPKGFVAFPDDDAWYPRGALGCISNHFQNPESTQLLLCRYGPSPSVDACNQIAPATLQRALTNGACATIFIRGRLLAELEGFHPLLGLGTPLCGGEDTEFVHRAFHRSKGQVVCLRAVLVGHAVGEPARKAQYYEGALAALFAHRKASGPARVAWFRKIAVGLWLVLNRRLSMPQYLTALRRAQVNASDIRAGPRPATAKSRIISG